METIVNENIEASLFETIRSEDVVVWIGAGMSFYAGYPSGEKLSNIFFDRLPEDKRIGLVRNNLQIVTQAYKDLLHNGEDEIIRVLTEEFLHRVPTSTYYHEILANIPHVKSIVTTNYDSLIEQCYAERGQTIYTDEQAHHLDNHKVQIFKIHGDLSVPDTIILTSGDYIRFFSKDQEKNIWAIIRERIATKTQLFLGYNLEDINVNYVFEQIWNNIRGDRKKCYLVAPHLPQYKIAHLANKNIDYIDSSGEAFIDRLCKNINDNILKDFDKGITSADTLRLFLNTKNLIPEIVGDEEQYKLKAIKGKTGKAEGTLNIEIKKDEYFYNKINDFLTGKQFDALEIPDELLKSFTFKVEGIPVVDSRDGIFKLEFMSQPSFESKFDIRFPETGYEKTDIPVKIFASSHLLELYIDLKQGLLKIRIDNPKSFPKINLNFNLVHNDLFSKTLDELDFHNFIINFFGGKKFHIYSKNMPPLIQKIDLKETMTNQAALYKNYIEQLRIVEYHYGIRFEDFPYAEVTFESEKILRRIIKVIKEEPIESEHNEDLKITYKEINADVIKQLEQINNIPNAVVAQNTILDEVTLHGQQFVLGYRRIEFQALSLSNKEELIEGKSLTARLRSQEGKCLVTYLKELPPEDLEHI